MKFLTSVLLLLPVLRLLIPLASHPSLATSGVPDTGEAGSIRVLLTHGGHRFQEEEFFAMFDALEGVKYTRALLPQIADLLKPGLQDQYDVIVMYDMVAQLTPKQQQDFVELLNQGIGLVSLHHNIGAHRGWDEFPRIIGGRYFFSEGVVDGQVFPPSRAFQDERIHVRVTDSGHSITRGLNDFEIVDETFNGCYIAPDNHFLLETDHPRSDSHLAWTRSYGRSRVFYFMLGHDSQAWRHQAYPLLLSQGIRWAAGSES